jgi:hypothetical protein
MSTRMETLDDFRSWAIFIDDYINNFIGVLSLEDQQKLDYSPQSLDIVEVWLLNKFPGLAAFFETEEDGLFDGIVCYVGEVFRINLDGKWMINLDDPNAEHYQLPVIKKFTDPSIPIISPLHLITNALEKRAGWYMQITLLAYKNKGNLSEGNIF